MKFKARYTWRTAILPGHSLILLSVVLILIVKTGPHTLISTMETFVLAIICIFDLMLLRFFMATFDVMYDGRLYFRGRALKSRAQLRNLRRLSDKSLEIRFNFFYIVHVIGAPVDISRLEAALKSDNAKHE